MYARHTESIINRKAYSFALEIVKVCKHLEYQRKEYVLSKQLLKSGTSVGANVNEAISAQSKADFVYKLGISLREARETLYWLRLLNDSTYLPPEDFNALSLGCNEIISILSSIILTTTRKYLQKRPDS
jgi:four helix bundle protein